MVDVMGGGAKMAFKNREFCVRKSATAVMKINGLALAFDAACPDYRNFYYYKKECFHNYPPMKDNYFTSTVLWIWKKTV